MDINRKKVFLQQGSELYHDMIELTDCDVVKRYLAFRIIVNTMSFEDLVNERRFPVIRQVRNTLLAHKQEAEFFAAFDAIELITEQSIDELLKFMIKHTHRFDFRQVPMERCDVGVQKRFEVCISAVLDKFVEDEVDGFRFTNNFLAHTGDYVHEISAGELAGVFYRYNSSQALLSLAQYVYNNTYKLQEFQTTTRHAKLDWILHAQNMADCVFRDKRNKYSIDGLLEVCQSQKLGDMTQLQKLSSDSHYRNLYQRVRGVRNSLIGHMDTKQDLQSLIEELDKLSTGDVYELVSVVDDAVNIATNSHIALTLKYFSASKPLLDENIIDIRGFEPKPYRDESGVSHKAKNA